MDKVKKYGAAECGDCDKCGKCAEMLGTETTVGANNNLPNTRPTSPATQTNNNIKNMEKDNEKKLYTFIIYSENIAGLLSQISAVFTRRQVNIETLNVCASSTPGVHKYTVTSNCTEEMAIMLTKQMEKKIDVLQANYYTDDDIFINETCLLKISTPVLLSDKMVSRIVRRYNARIVEVNPTYATVEKTGMTDSIIALFNDLNAIDGCVVQFVRSGRIAITKSTTERLDAYLAEREKRHNL